MRWFAPSAMKSMTLRRVARERDVEHDAVAERVLRNLRFLHERAVLAEHLNAIVGAVAHIHQPVVGDLRAVHRAEHLGYRRRRIVRAGIGVVRLLAVRAPMPLVRAGVGVEHDHAAIAVAVGDVHFVGGDDRLPLRPRG